MQVVLTSALTDMNLCIHTSQVSQQICLQISYHLAILPVICNINSVQKKIYYLQYSYSILLMCTQRLMLPTCWLIRTGFLISGYIPTILGASSAIEINSSKVMMENFPAEHIGKSKCY